MQSTYSVNLLHTGKPVGPLELVSDNSGFASMICLMLASMVVVFFALA